MVTVDECRQFDPGRLSSWTDGQVQGALDAETAAQSRVCRMPDPVPADLTEALKRRVQVNLSMRPLPLAVATGDAESGPTILPTNDPMVRRYEKPFRRRVVG